MLPYRCAFSNDSINSSCSLLSQSRFLRSYGCLFLDFIVNTLALLRLPQILVSKSFVNSLGVQQSPEVFYRPNALLVVCDTKHFIEFRSEFHLCAPVVGVRLKQRIFTQAAADVPL